MKVLLLLIGLAAVHAASDVERAIVYPDAVAFKTTSSDGLVWPLPDSNDLTSVFIHGLHCKAMLALNHNDTEMGAMHIKHCSRVVQEIQHEVAKMAPIDHTVCMSLFGLNSEYYIMRGLMGSYSYYTDDLLDKIDVGGVVADSKVNLVKLSGYNYGRLLMKEYRDATSLTEIVTLTQVERAYLDSWFEPVKAKQAAIAYACEAQGISIFLDESDVKAGAYTTSVTEPMGKITACGCTCQCSGLMCKEASKAGSMCGAAVKHGIEPGEACSKAQGELNKLAAGLAKLSGCTGTFHT